MRKTELHQDGETVFHPTASKWQHQEEIQADVSLGPAVPVPTLHLITALHCSQAHIILSLFVNISEPRPHPTVNSHHRSAGVAVDFLLGGP